MTYHNNTNNKRLYLVKFTLAASALIAVACGDTIDVFPDDNQKGDGGQQTVQTDGGLADASDRPPDSSDFWPDAEILADGSSNGPIKSCDDARSMGAITGEACDFLGGCGGVQPCASYTLFCTERQVLARTESAYQACDERAGFTGDYKRVVSTCGDALEGASGESCGRGFTCGRRSAESCCIDLALCGTDPQSSRLRVARVCVPRCETIPLVVGTEVTSCRMLYEVGKGGLPANTILPAGRLSALEGYPCSGDFVCGSQGEDLVNGTPDDVPLDSYGSAFFCGAGKVQTITLGTEPLPEL